jgi:hypothetical protein
MRREKSASLYQSTLITPPAELNGRAARQTKFLKKAVVKKPEHGGPLSAASPLVRGAGQLIA